MSQLTTKIQVEDGQVLSAYAKPVANASAAIVVLQEIFGVNSHIRSVVDRYAQEGYWTIAPSLFDRVQPDVDLGYEKSDMQAGFGIAQKLQQDKVLLDIAATIKYAREQVGGRKVGVVGYCMGGSYAWLSVTRLDADAAVSYYGGAFLKTATEVPKKPVILHFGKADLHIPVADVEKVAAERPELPIYLYDADHGFNCDQRASYDKAAADLALSRSLSFFKEHLGS